ncbi:YcxB family protein [Tellurirhabdus rosea]|uniref:YcxB family protein n=1 Tax=Tellurirhabdus rosea TaxID=2674997 RepID=UPI0022586DC7|nr:YcxB family protein [Tellurirhabdus rosea]
MTIKTKKYALDQKTYLNLIMRSWFKTHWYWLAIPLVLIVVNIVLYATDVVDVYWPAILLFIGTLIYVLFWAVQFTGMTQMEQAKPLFDKYVYEIDSRWIMLWKNAREGGKLEWKQFTAVRKDKDAYILTMSNDAAMQNVKMNWFMKLVAKGMTGAQFLYLPYSIFGSENDLRFMDAILKRKGLLAENA